MAKKTKPTKTSKKPVKAAKLSAAKPAAKSAVKSKAKPSKVVAPDSKLISKQAKKAVKPVPKVPVALKKALPKVMKPVTPKKPQAAPVSTKISAKVSTKVSLKVSTNKVSAKVSAKVVETVKIKPAKVQKPQKIVVPMMPEPAPQEVILTNADGLRYCKVTECDELSTSDGYCRYHYLAHWKRIQLRKRILAGDKLDRYIEELTARYPDKYLEMIRKDLASEKDFATAIQELEIDGGGEEGEFEDEARSYIDEVRGVTTGEGTGSSSDEDF